MRRIFFLLLSLSACARDGATIVVENRSGAVVSDVAVTAREFAYRIPELKPGEVRTFSADPRGESGIAVLFSVDGRAVKIPEQGYFESDPRYVVVVRIHPDGATVATTVKAGEP